MEKSAKYSNISNSLGNQTITPKGDRQSGINSINVQSTPLEIAKFVSSKLAESIDNQLSKANHSKK